MKYLAIIDDGHGLETIGKRTPLFPDSTFMRENEFNSAVTFKLGDKLKDRGIDVLYTAPNDQDIPLVNRSSLANSYYATMKSHYGHSNINAICISIHANALKGVWGNWGGIETYYHAKREDSKLLAYTIHKHLIRGTVLRNRGVKTSNFHMTRVPTMPCILVECGFMDNITEATLLRSDLYRDECADELFTGICEYFNIPVVPEKPWDEKAMDFLAEHKFISQTHDTNATVTMALFGAMMYNYFKANDKL